MNIRKIVYSYIKKLQICSKGKTKSRQKVIIQDQKVIGREWIDIKNVN